MVPQLNSGVFNDRHSFGGNHHLQAFRQGHKAAVAQNIGLAASASFEPSDFVAHAEFADQLLGPRFRGQPAFGPGFEHAAVHLFGADQAAGSGIEDSRLDAGAPQVISAGQPGNSTADDCDFSTRTPNAASRA